MAIYHFNRQFISVIFNVQLDYDHLRALGKAGVLLVVFQRADAVDDLQVVVLREVEHETVGHRLDFAEAAIDEHGFSPL